MRICLYLVKSCRAMLSAKLAESSQGKGMLPESSGGEVDVEPMLWELAGVELPGSLVDGVVSVWFRPC